MRSLVKAILTRVENKILLEVELFETPFCHEYHKLPTIAHSFGVHGLILDPCSWSQVWYSSMCPYNTEIVKEWYSFHPS
jgi:hypothetical protein